VYYCYTSLLYPSWILGSQYQRTKRSVSLPPGSQIFVYCERCVLSGGGLCDGPITRPEKSYRLWCIIVCHLETSRMRRLWPTLGCSAREENCLVMYCGTSVLISCSTTMSVSSDQIPVILWNISISVASTQGAGSVGLQPPKSKFKKKKQRNFCKEDVKNFKSFTPQLKSSTGIRWWKIRTLKLRKIK
jgi:hypothetical protein